MNESELDHLRRRLGDVGLRDHAAALVSLIEPAVRLVPDATDGSPAIIGATKLGGCPDLAPGTEWPSFQGVPQSFIAQINLGEVAGMAGTEVLPDSGLLSFFYDAEQRIWGFDPADRGGWRVLHTIEADLVRVAFPADLRDHGRYQERRLRPRIETTFAPWASSDLERLGLESSQVDAYLAVVDEVYSNDGEIHRLLGHPDPIQGDMQLECQLTSNGLYCGDASGYEDARAPTLQRGAVNWRLLLQIGSDEGAGMCWGDAGCLYFWLHRDDLAARRFDAAWCILQCS